MTNEQQILSRTYTYVLIQPSFELCKEFWRDAPIQALQHVKILTGAMCLAGLIVRNPGGTLLVLEQRLDALRAARLLDLRLWIHDLFVCHRLNRLINTWSYDDGAGEARVRVDVRGAFEECANSVRESIGRKSREVFDAESGSTRSMEATTTEI